jgi:hypothetical protein
LQGKHPFSVNCKVSIAICLRYCKVRVFFFFFLSIHSAILSRSSHHCHYPSICAHLCNQKSTQARASKNITRLVNIASACSCFDTFHLGASRHFLAMTSDIYHSCMDLSNFTMSLSVHLVKDHNEQCSYHQDLYLWLICGRADQSASQQANIWGKVVAIFRCTNYMTMHPAHTRGQHYFADHNCP